MSRRKKFKHKPIWVPAGEFVSKPGDMGLCRAGSSKNLRTRIHMCIASVHPSLCIFWKPTQGRVFSSRVVRV